MLMFENLETCPTNSGNLFCLMMGPPIIILKMFRNTMSLLDLQVRMEEGEVDWRFFRKEFASSYFLLNRSAVSAKVNRTMLAQEGVQRFRNTKPSKVKEEKVQMMEEMSEMMMRSGYPET